MNRVLHFTPGFNYGGIESLLMAIHQQLDHEKIQFDLITDNLNKKNSNFDSIRNTGGFVYQFGNFTRRPLTYLQKFRRILNQYDRNNTTLHVHDPVRGMPLLHIADTMGFKNRVIHSHNDSFKGTRFPLLSRLSAHSCVKSANKYIACSENAGKFLFGRRPFEVFKNPIDIELYKFNPERRKSIRARLNISGESVVIGHTGRFSHQKNHAWIIKVFSNFLKSNPTAILLIVGDGELLSKMRWTCKNNKIFESVRFVGRQPDIAGHLSAMDVFFMPSHFEGLGISAIEAQANGLPCLLSDVFPEETFATDAVISLPLSNPVQNWSRALRDLATLQRFDSAQSIIDLRHAGFDINKEWKKLLSFYGCNY